MITFAGFDVALRDHLSANLYPPIAPTHSNVAQAKAAVELVANGNGSDPVGTDGIAADVLVEAWHLEVFVDALAIEQGLD